MPKYYCVTNYVERNAKEKIDMMKSQVLTSSNNLVLEGESSSTLPTTTSSSMPSTSKRLATIHQRWQQPQQSALLNIYSWCILAIIFISLPAYSNAIDTGNKLNLTPTRYTNYTKHVQYSSSTQYNSRGMQPLYNITHNIMWLFIGDEPLPDGYITFKDMEIHPGPKVKRNEWIDLVKHYWAIWLVVLIVGLLAVAMPIIGFCFCCCRCAGACGGVAEPFDKKHDTCRRVILGFMLIVLATGQIFGVIIAFATNSYLHIGISESTTSVRDGSSDTQLFLSTTSDQIDQVLVVNYKELSDNLEKILRDTSSYIIVELEVKSSAVSIVYLTEFLAKLPLLKNKLQEMKTITNELRVYASQLSDGLRGVKRDLLVMLTKCNVQACQDVLTKYEIGKLDANGIHYDQLPDVTEIIDTVDKLISEDVATAGTRGREALEGMRAHLNKTIAQYTPQIIDSIHKAGLSFSRTSNDIKHNLQKSSHVIGNQTKKFTGIADDFLDEYNPYRFYFGLTVCVILLLILLCLIIALLCGICGKRPDGYGDDCCNKGAGSRFLMCSVALIFLSISATAIIALVHFLLGSVAYRGICVPLSDPQNDAVFAAIDNSVDLNDLFYNQSQHKGSSSGKLPPFRISHMINACQKNQTIYEVMRIQNRIDIHEINDYPVQYKINQTLENLVNGIDFEEGNVEILSAEDKQRILSLGATALNRFDSGQFIDNLNDTITKYSLSVIAQQLRETANKITSPDMKDVQVSLRNQALHLETYEQNLVNPMKKQSNELIKLAKELDQALRYKDHTFQDSVPLLVNEIEHAQKFIREEGRPFVKATAQDLTRYFAKEIERYLSMVVDAVENRIGLCQPLANVYDAGIVAACNRIVDPLNGFWAGVAWCVVLFLPTLIVAVKLANLYQKSDPYPGPLVEAEYLYDAYSERDHIPLANGAKNKRRKNKDRRRREYYEETIGSATHGIPPTSSAVGRDTRYSDMAPKHWDGGPPRYQNPPMAPPASEYERPPPYYYPGATEQD